MGKVSKATVAVISAIALYFAVVWGFEAFAVLTSPAYGLDDVWRSQVVFTVGSYFKLSPAALLQLAAFVGALKLAAALACAVHLADRLRAMGGGKANVEILEGGLIIVVALTILSAGPAMWTQNSGLLREHALQLLLAALAVALCLVERNHARRAAPLGSALPRNAGAFAPWR